MHTAVTLTKLIFLVAFPGLILAQNAYQFKPNLSVPCMVGGKSLQLPWAGGMNTPQFNQLDVNADGFHDLVIFDRMSESFQVFLNGGNPGSENWSYAWEYENAFPEIANNFVLLRDWNCDGKEDLFTYAPGGYRLFHNVSEGAYPKYAFLTDYLRAELPSGGASGVYSLDVDYNVIDDIDSDGDLDFLGFGVFGTQVTWWENIADNCDTLHLIERQGCWGNFFESAQTATLILNQSCKGRSSAARHAGSTLLTLDMNNDGAKELILGDVESRQLTMLTNGGTPKNADMVSQDVTFPSNNIPVDIREFVASFYLDINNDGVRDFIAAPFDKNIHEDINNVWLYRNSGSDNQPNISYTTNNFLVGEQIDLGTGANPELIDLNGDGLLDLLVGNLGYFENELDYRSQLAYFKNVGSPDQPAFHLVTDDYLGLSTQDYTNLAPAVADLNGDGSADLILGNRTGDLLYYENTAAPNDSAKFVLSSPSLLDTTLNEDLFPHFFDINNDGVQDLLIGKRRGLITLYLNRGTAQQPDFQTQPDVDTLGGIQQGFFGFANYMHPEVAVIENDTLLLIGDNNGWLKLYSGFSNYAAPSFTVVDSIRINAGAIAPTTGNLFNSDSNAIVIGQLTGGLTIFQQSDSVLMPESMVPDTTSWPTVTSVEPKSRASVSSQFLFPNPSGGTLTLKESAGTQLHIYSITGQLMASRPIDPQAPVYRFELPSGVYVAVELDKGLRVRQQKIIIF